MMCFGGQEVQLIPETEEEINQNLENLESVLKDKIFQVKNELHKEGMEVAMNEDEFKKKNCGCPMK